MRQMLHAPCEHVLLARCALQTWDNGDTVLRAILLYHLGQAVAQSKREPDQQQPSQRYPVTTMTPEQILAAGQAAADALTVRIFRAFITAEQRRRHSSFAAPDLDACILHLEKAPAGQTLDEFAASKVRHASGYREVFAPLFKQAVALGALEDSDDDGSA